MDVGVRALRDGLSRHLAAVKTGQTVTVTEHGRPIARLVPVDRPTALEELVAAGRITPAARPKRPARAPVETAAPISDLLDEQRG